MAKRLSQLPVVLALVILLSACAAASKGKPQISVTDITAGGSPLVIMAGTVDDVLNAASPAAVPLVWTFEIKNTGEDTLTLPGGTTLTSSNVDFVATAPAVSSLAAGQSTTLTVTFSNYNLCAMQLFTSTMTLSSNDPSTGSMSFTLNGNANDPNQC